MGQSRRVFASSGNELGSSFFSPLGPKCCRTMSSSVGRSSSRWLRNRRCRIVRSGISFILRSTICIPQEDCAATIQTESLLIVSTAFAAPCQPLHSIFPHVERVGYLEELFKLLERALR